MTPQDKSGPVLPYHQNTMPTLSPVPIETKGKGFFTALWIWFRYTREWKFESDWDFYCPEIGKTIVIPKGFVFDGASVPKRLRAYLSPVGLLLVPGIIHDFGYRYDYVWVRKSDGSIAKDSENAGQKHWDRWFFTVGNYVNGIFIINFLAWFALTLGGWLAWKKKRKIKSVEIKPDPIVFDTSTAAFKEELELQP